MKNKDKSSSCCNNRHQQSSKRFCNFCKRFGHNIGSCYHRNKSAVSIFAAVVAQAESVQPMAPVSAQSKSLGRTFTMSTDDLKNIIVNVFHMIGNASYSSSLSVLSSMSPSSWLMDSACCNYMTHHSSLFSKLKPASHPLNIRTANDSTMSGHNIGSVSISNLSVPGVFNVPDLSYNLFYVEQLAKLGYCIIFDYFGCIVQDPKDRTGAWDWSQSWAYVSRGKPSSSTCCSCFCCCSCCSFFNSFPCTLACLTWSCIFLDRKSVV